MKNRNKMNIKLKYSYNKKQCMSNNRSFMKDRYLNSKAILK